MTAVGVYEGNDPKTVEGFKAWFGDAPDFIRGNGGRANWTDYVESLSWIGKQFSKIDIPIYWTVPMFANGGTLAKGATGAYDPHYVEAAKRLLAASPDSDVIYVRVGEEFNGDWFPWAAEGKEHDFIATYRHFVDSFRSVSDKFKFEWNVNIGEHMDPAKAYPGDKYVDIIGMDFYYYKAWDIKDPSAAFDSMVSRQYGLQWLEDFAASHHKPTAYSEWGIDSDAGAYVAKAAKWFQDHNVLYQSYWDSNAGFQGKLSDGQHRSTGDAFKEAFSHHDTVTSSVGCTLTGQETNLVLPGSSAINGTGNNLDNTITGNSAANVLDGRGGADTMTGKAGDDTYVVDNSNDRVNEDASGGYDTVRTNLSKYTLPANVEALVYTGSSAFTGTGNQLDNHLTGGSGNDRLDGGAGNDVLDGGAGADALIGGKGDDLYIVDNAGDTVFELFDAGTDTVQTSLSSYTLAKNLENLIFTGKGDAILIGNTGSNTLTGGDGNDVLDGGSGTDTLIGGRGNDRYIVDNAADVVVEAPGGGTDTIMSRVSLKLADNVENLTLTTTASINGTGNALDNVIIGNAGLNVLDGGAGRDTLTGLGNNDTFLFRKGEANGDVVTDFTGAGAAKGDVLMFVGYGNATLTHSTDPAHPDWYVITPDAAHGGAAAAETIEITGVTNLDLLIGKGHNDIVFA